MTSDWGRAEGWIQWFSGGPAVVSGLVVVAQWWCGGGLVDLRKHTFS